MNNFYQWLYDQYAATKFDDSTFSATYQQQKSEWEEFARQLSNHHRLLSIDLLNSMKLCWGAQAFAYGVHAGLLLAAGLPASDWEE